MGLRKRPRRAARRQRQWLSGESSWRERTIRTPPARRNARRDLLCLATGCYIRLVEQFSASNSFIVGLSTGRRGFSSKEETAYDKRCASCFIRGSGDRAHRDGGAAGLRADAPRAGQARADG